MTGPFRSRRAWRADDARIGWALCAPALGLIALVGLVPMAWTIWESFHLDDLRMPWLGRPFVGAANYVEVLSSARFHAALAHTAFFVVVSVSLELAGGLLLALLMHRAVRARGLVRTAALLPWAIPTVVSALAWRFMFESPNGLADAVSASLGAGAPAWLADPYAAWIPVIFADVWKTTPFVAILLLAGLQQIDPTLYEAADLDGAGAWRRLVEITLPLLRPALVVACLFRALDAFRVFDTVYVLTGGGPGTATEPIALLTFTAILQDLRFGFGSSLAVVMFLLAVIVAAAGVRIFGREAFLESRS